MMDDLLALISTTVSLPAYSAVAIAGLSFVAGQICGSIVLWNVLAKSGWINTQQMEQ